MKIIKIALKDLKEFFLQKTGIFIILFISLIISSYGFLFFTSLNMNSSQWMNLYKGTSNNFFISKNKLEKEKIKNFTNKLIQKYPNITYRLYSSVEIGDKIKYLTEQNIEKERQLYNLIIGTNKTIANSAQFVGRELNIKDRENYSNYIMIDYLSNLAQEDIYILNKNININNHIYNVQAIDHININTNKYIEKINPKKINIENINDIQIGIIADTTFYKENYEIYGFEIITNIGTPENIKEEIIKLINDNFSDSQIIIPTKMTESLSDINYYTIFYMFLMGIALVNIIALFRYWIDKNWRKYMIYRLCGATNFKIYKLIFVESIIICISTIIISICLYYSSIEILKLLKINYILNFSELLTISLIVLLFVMLNVHFIAKKISKVEVRYIGRI